MKKRMVVAMSGGVDSSLAACLLKEKGYEVIGATMRIWKEEGQRNPYGCCGAVDVADARRIAQQLGIPYYVFNLEEEFEKEVIQYFCEEYQKGRTPNPCILCNERMKFGVFLRKALELEADWFATGHYARVALDERTGRYVLRKGIDKKKDQSYVLFSLTQDQLDHALFPIGDYVKEEVRSKALHVGLRVHDKPESQEICFIHESSYHSFLKERLAESVKPGSIVDKDGNILGEHKGIPFYTIGQRRGLRLAKGKPLYVVEIDRKKNAIIVEGKEDVFADTFIVDSLNWTSPQDTSSPFSAQVKIRYNHPGSEAVLSPGRENEIEITFNNPQKAITPGQAAVFYDGDRVIGGGWIKEVINDQ